MLRFLNNHSKNNFNIIINCTTITTNNSNEDITTIGTTTTKTSTTYVVKVRTWSLFRHEGGGSAQPSPDGVTIRRATPRIEGEQILRLGLHPEGVYDRVGWRNHQ